jgi:hypothetical protein
MIFLELDETSMSLFVFESEFVISAAAAKNLLEGGLT